jgi:hypothetical protein
MSDTVTITGKVCDSSHTPIFMIKVRAIQQGREVERTYTGEDGTYSFEVPRALTTLMFDTHESLVNARDWHPSVVANIEPDVAEAYLRCDRILMRVGTSGTDESCADALAGYLFGILLHTGLPDGDYAEYADVAAARVSMLKMGNTELDEIRGLVRKIFYQNNQ